MVGNFSDKFYLFPIPRHTRTPTQNSLYIKFLSISKLLSINKYTYNMSQNTQRDPFKAENNAVEAALAEAESAKLRNRAGSSAVHDFMRGRANTSERIVATKQDIVYHNVAETARYLASTQPPRSHDKKVAFSDSVTIAPSA